MARRNLADYLAETRGDDEPDGGYGAGTSGFNLGYDIRGAFDLGVEAAMQAQNRGFAPQFTNAAAAMQQQAMRRFSQGNQNLAMLQNGSPAAHAAAMAEAEEMGRRAAAGKALVSTSPPNDRRLQPLGLNSTGSIALSSSQNIQGQPLVFFRPRRLLVPQIIAGPTVGGVPTSVFRITDVKVNQRSQFVNSTAISALSFVENATTASVDWDTCQPQGLIILSVTNTDGANAHVFESTLYGEVAV